MAGQWDSDLIVGPNPRSEIGTLPSDRPGTPDFQHLSVQDSPTFHAALARTLGICPRRYAGASPETRAPRWAATWLAVPRMASDWDSGRSCLSGGYAPVTT